MHKNAFTPERKIACILHKKLSVPQELLTPENWNKPLSASPFRLSGVQLAHLFFEVEKSFDIRIESQYLNDYGFSSIEDISRAVKNCKTT